MTDKQSMEKIIAFFTTGILIFNLLTIFETTKGIDDNITANGIVYDQSDEEYGGLIGKGPVIIMFKNMFFYSFAYNFI